jgi:hypothetical protein
VQHFDAFDVCRQSGQLPANDEPFLEFAFAIVVFAFSIACATALLPAYS